MAHHHTHGDKKSKLNAAIARLKAASFKLTEPRRLLLEVLVQRHGPFSAEELHVHVLKKKPKASCDLVTIYRSLATFEELNLIQRCDFGDNTVRYELFEKDHHHHHIICEKCLRSEAVDVCPVGEKNLINDSYGFTNVRHRLEFFGLCPACQ